MHKGSILAADIGGTNVRLGAYHDGALVGSARFSTKTDGALLNLMHGFAEGMAMPPEVVVAAAAGPVANNAVELTNAKQTLCGAELQDATGAKEARIINDFAAAAWATLAPLPEHLQVLQGAETPPEGTRLVIGPGTGLGVGALAHVEGRYASLPGEGGHVGIAPRTRQELEIFEALRAHWPEVFFGDSLVIEAEGILSGTGLPFLYRAVQDVHGGGVSAPDAADIMRLAKHQEDTCAVTTVEVFKAHLAKVAGDQALALNAAGVFLVGGVAMKNAWLFDAAFVSGFGKGGRYDAERSALNLYLLNVENFGLEGAHTYAEQLAADL